MCARQHAYRQAHNITVCARKHAYRQAHNITVCARQHAYRQAHNITVCARQHTHWQAHNITVCWQRAINGAQYHDWPVQHNMWWGIQPKELTAICIFVDFYMYLKIKKYICVCIRNTFVTLIVFDVDVFLLHLYTFIMTNMCALKNSFWERVIYIQIPKYICESFCVHSFVAVIWRLHGTLPWAVHFQVPLEFKQIVEILQ